MKKEECYNIKCEYLICPLTDGELADCCPKNKIEKEYGGKR